MSAQEILERASGVDGLIIWGNPRRGGYRLVTRIARAGVDEPKQLPVFEDRRGDIKMNLFDRVRDARAAAKRLADFLPWTDPAALDAHMRGLDPAARKTFQIALAERLTGRSISDLEAEHSAQMAARQAWADGTGPRDAYDADLTAAGHEVTWTRKGERTYWATCSRCGGQFRSSYSSHSRSYNRTSSVGYGYPMPGCSSIKPA